MQDIPEKIENIRTPRQMGAWFTANFLTRDQAIEGFLTSYEKEQTCERARVLLLLTDLTHGLCLSKKIRQKIVSLAAAGIERTLHHIEHTPIVALTIEDLIIAAYYYVYGSNGNNPEQILEAMLNKIVKASPRDAVLLIDKISQVLDEVVKGDALTAAQRDLRYLAQDYFLHGAQRRANGSFSYRGEKASSLVGLLGQLGERLASDLRAGINQVPNLKVSPNGAHLVFA